MIIKVLDYIEATAGRHARLIAHARRAGTPCGAHDLIMAAHAVQTDHSHTWCQGPIWRSSRCDCLQHLKKAPWQALHQNCSKGSRAQ
jgi:hypothetical protein